MLSRLNLKGVLQPLADRLRKPGVGKVVVLSGALAVVMVFAVGAGAAPSPLTPVAEVLGISSDHGAAVSESVQDARESIEDGDKPGPAISEAACNAAQDRSTLPQGAQDAPGQEDRDSKDCTHPNDGSAAGGTNNSDPEEQGEHGSAVSQSVHDAVSSARDSGESVRPAASEAACSAAHDRSTLPQGARNAPGQQEQEPKDCAHSSKAEIGPGAGGGSQGQSGGLSAPERPGKPKDED